MNSRLKVAPSSTLLTSLVVLVNKAKVLPSLLALVGAAETLLALDGFGLFRRHSLGDVAPETHLVRFNPDTSQCGSEAPVASTTLVVTRQQLCALEPTLHILRLQLQRLRVKSRNLRLSQVERVQVVATSLSQPLVDVTVEAQQINVHSIDYDRVSLLVLERKLNLCCVPCFAVCCCHAKVDLETFTVNDVRFRFERHIFVLRCQGPHNKVKVCPISAGTSVGEPHFLVARLRAQAAKVIGLKISGGDSEGSDFAKFRNTFGCTAAVRGANNRT